MDLAALPRPPVEPSPLECCQRGCCPCVYDYWRDARTRWEKKIREQGLDPAVVEAAFAREPG